VPVLLVGVVVMDVVSMADVEIFPWRLEIIV
jgi:hypothetical protein